MQAGGMHWAIAGGALLFLLSLRRRRARRGMAERAYFAHDPRGLDLELYIKR